MAKNIQFKIVLIFFIIGITIISGLGIFYINSLNTIQAQIGEVTVNEIQQIINNTRTNINTVLIISGIVFTIITIFIAMFLSKFVIYPVNKLIQSAEKIKEEDKNIVTKGKKKKDVGNLENVFDMMTTELTEKLSEVSTQKNQIETILLHMTDGIIAFNMKGEIILINPAAKNFLSIGPEDIMFDDIFKKFKLDINMEKIIYLESWTSTEQRLKVEDKYVKVLFAPFKDESDRPNGVIAVINVIASEARRMARLVTDLLTLSRYDSNKKGTQKESFDLGDLVKRCQEKLGIEIQKKNHNVSCFVTADVPPVYADKYDIERVVLNILTNSIKYTPEGGEIKIYVGFVYNDAYIKVFDNGIGIPEEDLNRIFERFYRVDKARTREMGGTGLGLSIAKEILDKNGGSIDIKSVVGQGTEVVVRIPTKV